MSFVYVKFHLDGVENEITSFNIVLCGSEILLVASHYSE